MEYSSLQDPDKEMTSFKIGDVIEVNFKPDVSSNINPNDPLSEREIVNKYQLIDETIDKLEGQVGCWNPSNKFMNLYP